MNILIVEDESIQRELIAGILREHPDDECTETASVEEAKEKMSLQIFDLIISDWKLPGKDGLSLLNHVRTECPETSFVLVTAYGSISHAITSIQSGADDYLSKPFEKTALQFTINKIRQLREIRQENALLKQNYQAITKLSGIIGQSKQMQKLYEQIDRVSSTNVTVLIQGESGTGKELVAQAIHQNSSRRNQIFLAVNCSAIPESIAEAELFGAEKGAYTGADKRKIGKLEAANKGTLFLDEIAELPLSIQAKLLRVLQENKVMRVGGNQEIELDVRVISATHKNLEQMIDEQLFREDLYYRLNVIPLNLPPLRDRKDDLPILIQFFIDKYSKQHKVPALNLSKNAYQSFFQHHWSGNIRELSNTIERLSVLTQGDTVTESDLPFIVKNDSSRGSNCFDLPTTGLMWDEFEKDILKQALTLSEQNKTKAAELLGLSYKTFLYRLEKYDIDSSNKQAKS